MYIAYSAVERAYALHVIVIEEHMYVFLLLFCELPSRWYRHGKGNGKGEGGKIEKSKKALTRHAHIWIGRVCINLSFYL
jgi:hypothetical protein